MGSQSFTARACAALLSVAHQHIDGTDKQLLTAKQITLSDVATRAKILPEKILKVQHQMEKLIPTAKKEAAHKGALLGMVFNIFSFMILFVRMNIFCRCGSYPTSRVPSNRCCRRRHRPEN